MNTGRTTQRRRVVITGTGNLSPLGNDWATVLEGLRRGTSAVQFMPEWAKIKGLTCKLAAPVALQLPAHYTRKVLRSMGRVAQLGVYAAEMALIDAKLLNDPCLKLGRTGVAFGSAAGGSEATLEFVSIFTENSTANLKATSYLRMMSHTAAVNIGVHFGLTGRVLTTSTACTAASQGLGFAYEAIRAGQQDIMLAGGADELTPAHSAVFDALFATTAQPDQTPRPFDAKRDGLVLGEGASCFVLEELDHALARGANIYAEIIGYGTNSDGAHITAPAHTTQAQCMRLALADAQVEPESIGYVNAHGTATDAGDLSESLATFDVLGPVPISSLKGHMGHTLGACGGLEAWMTLGMMLEGWFAPTLNLDQLDPACAALDYLTGDGRKIETNRVMTNNFAFGGINTSLIMERFG